MTFLEIARRWTIVLLAETLKISASAVEAVLPFQPRWLAQIALLAAQLRAAADRDEDWDEEDDVLEAAQLPNTEALLASHTCLRQGMSDIVARGLALDEDLLQRMRTDWNLESVISYLSSAEANLRAAASQTLDNAAEPLGMSTETMATLADHAPAAAPAKQPELVR